jgi:hypothetical protein
VRRLASSPPKPSASSVIDAASGIASAAGPPTIAADVLAEALDTEFPFDAFGSESSEFGSELDDPPDDAPEDPPDV